MSLPVFDRGHMVRRLDPVWGIEDAARLANSDTHHSTFFGGSNNVVGIGGTFGPRFREDEGFRCFGGTASAEVPVERCPTASILDGGPGGRAVGSLTLCSDDWNEGV